MVARWTIQADTVPMRRLELHIASTTLQYPELVWNS